MLDKIVKDADEIAKIIEIFKEQKYYETEAAYRESRPFELGITCHDCGVEHYVVTFYLKNGEMCQVVFNEGSVVVDGVRFFVSNFDSYSFKQIQGFVRTEKEPIKSKFFLHLIEMWHAKKRPV